MLLFYLGLLVAFTTALCELAAKREWLPYWVSRKILHVVAVGSCAVAGYTADSLGHRELLTWIVAGAEVVLIGLVGFGGLMREESGRRAWGIVWFPLAFLVLLLITQREEMIGFFMATLAICDPAATVAGKLLRSGKAMPPDVLDARYFLSKSPRTNILTTPYRLTGDPKTLVGNLAFFVAFMLLVFSLPVSYHYGADSATGSPEYLREFYPLLSLVSIGILLTAGEAVGSRGLDNLIVPLLAAGFFNLKTFRHYTYDAGLLSGGILLSVAFVYATTRKTSLTTGGAIAASIMGILIAYAAGPEWTTPLLLFFASSSAIGKIFPAYSSAGDAKQKQARDATQVLANGFIFLVVALLYAPDDYMIYPWKTEISFPSLLLITAATATADTWSSELGQYFRRPTWDLIKWRRVPAGLSGGVSWPGTLAGLGGAALIASLGWWLLPDPSLSQILRITGFGFLGMLLDSALGSLLQATYRDPITGALSDVCPQGGQPASGFPWMTNDLVNFLAIGLTTLLAALLPG